MAGIRGKLVRQEVALLVVGLIYTFGGRIQGLARLPEDVAEPNRNDTMYFPTVTTALMTLLPTAAPALFRRRPPPWGRRGRILPPSARRARDQRRQVHSCELQHHRKRDGLRAGMGGNRNPRGVEHRALAREDQRDRRHRLGPILRGGRALRGLLRGQE